MLITFPNLESDASQWISDISGPVNPKQSLLFQASQMPDGRLLVSNAGNVAYAGGLVSRKLKPPPGITDFTFIKYAQLSTNITIPASSLFNLARLETDLIVVFTSGASETDPMKYPRNKKNCSTELNLETGFFEVDASSGQAAWSSIGVGPGTKLIPDVEHQLIINCAFDHANMKHSVQSIQWDSIKYGVPLNFQGVLDQPSNWSVVASIQKQNEILKPGSSTVIYRGTTLTFSDQPFS